MPLSGTSLEALWLFMCWTRSAEQSYNLITRKLPGTAGYSTSFKALTFKSTTGFCQQCDHYFPGLSFFHEVTASRRSFSILNCITVHWLRGLRNSEAPELFKTLTVSTMPNVISRIAPPDEVPAAGRLSPILDIAIRQTAALSLEEPDVLSYFPTEIRLMIFEELLVVWPKIVFRGAHDFGPLAEQEFEEEISIPWQILATCHKYYEEAVPIMYSKNRFVFCTGKGGEPGMFWRFPIHTRYMLYLTDLGIYLRADTPTKQAAKRVAHFVKALSRLAIHLEYLVVMISSDALYEQSCPWDIMFFDHPVAKALVQLVEAKTVKHLKLRLHDNACVFPGFAQFLNQAFYKEGVPTDRSIVFSRSCTCPPLCPNHPTAYCLHCGWPVISKPFKPVDVLVDPVEVESDMERMMDMQHELFELGILPPKDYEDEEEGDEYEENAGPYGGGGPIEDDYEEQRKAFDSGLLLPGQVRRYRGEVLAPPVWFFEQRKITDFFGVGL
ncbi:Nn.00g096820.m01.CDS01 [Neocucurbitaria sp. VM-36]